MQCPRCRSAEVFSNVEATYNPIRGAVGQALLGIPGALLGFGEGEVINNCRKCGYRWAPAELRRTETVVDRPSSYVGEHASLSEMRQQGFQLFAIFFRLLYAVSVIGVAAYLWQSSVVVACGALTLLLGLAILLRSIELEIAMMFWGIALSFLIVASPVYGWSQIQLPPQLPSPLTLMITTVAILALSVVIAWWLLREMYLAFPERKRVWSMPKQPRPTSSRKDDREANMLFQTAIERLQEEKYQEAYRLLQRVFDLTQKKELKRRVSAMMKDLLKAGIEK